MEKAMTYTIRPIEARDNEAVEAVIRACLLEFGGNRPGTAWYDPGLSRFSEVYRGEGRAYWVAVDEGGRVVGGTGIGELEGVPGVCELQKMYCLPEARGTGAAASPAAHAAPTPRASPTAPAASSGAPPRPITPPCPSWTATPTGPRRRGSTAPSSPGASSGASGLTSRRCRDVRQWGIGNGE